uniref:NADH dehydrogenase subunit 4 n=1 Tax=Rabdotus mooreanus TaxID=3014811 RepID=UPI00286CF440|nr:NADH dehydrogenase subunit 4 [Rabdotus mooreanus]WLN31341.1 NADH dehydrogenase subunit 4 [Rabdotus mooreanus]
MTITMLSIMFSILLVNDWLLNILGLVLVSLIALINIHNSLYMGENLFIHNHFMSNIMVFLTVVLTTLIFMSNPTKEKKFNACLMILAMILVITFQVNNLFYFYVFFELSLLPTLYLIIGWGYQPERLQAGLYMMLYTVGASLPLLFFILWQFTNSQSMNLYLLELEPIKLNGVLMIIVMLAFLAKLPMYTMHLWLPKAHVEAPLAGSMILAGVLLKLGGYGLYLFSKILEFEINQVSVILLVTLMLWGGGIAAIQCLMQNDIKAYVAYSSITHMSMVSVAILLNFSWGIFSSLLIMFTHGFTSSALFLLAYMTYKKAGSRSLSFMGGYLNLYPALSLMWFIFCSINMAAPPSVNLVGELSFMGCISIMSVSLICMSLMIMFLSVVYNMMLYSQVNHGGSSDFSLGSSSISLGPEYISLFLHLGFLLFILKLNLFLF